jgi:hypothetical protein
MSKNFCKLAARISVGVRFIQCGVGAVQVAVGDAAWVAGPPVVALVGGGVARPKVTVFVTVAPDGLLAFAVVDPYVDKDASVLKRVAVHVEQLVAAIGCADFVFKAVVGHRAALVSGVVVWCGLAQLVEAAQLRN